MIKRIFIVIILFSICLDSQATSLNEMIAQGGTPVDTSPIAQAIYARKMRKAQEKIDVENQKLQLMQDQKSLEEHDLDMQIKRAQLAKLKSELPPDLKDYDSLDKYFSDVVAFGKRKGIRDAQQGYVSKKMLNDDRLITKNDYKSIDINQFKSNEDYLAALNRFGEAQGHLEALDDLK